jgi:hypothetical protein
MKYLSHYTEQAQTALFEQTGSFFAFGQKQFDEAKKPGIKYVSLGAGLICPKENIDTLLDGLENINKLGIAADLKENGAVKIIEREYFNHECQISMNTQDAEKKLKDYVKFYPELFTPELMKETFKACFNKAVENDWF